MMKTWLIRRSVRRPVADEVTSRISSSVCRLPFIRSSPLPSRISATACAAAAWLCGASTICRPVEVDAVLGRHVADLQLGADQHRVDELLGRGLDRAAQRGLVAGVGDDRHRRRAVAGGGDQALVLRVGLGQRMPPPSGCLAVRHQLRAEAEEGCDAAQALGRHRVGGPLASTTLFSAA